MKGGVEKSIGIPSAPHPRVQLSEEGHALGGKIPCWSKSASYKQGIMGLTESRDKVSIWSRYLFSQNYLWWGVGREGDKGEGQPWGLVEKASGQRS